ncbi:MAG: TolC family protein [Candidatus Omnitrophota bacterium]
MKKTFMSLLGLFLLSGSALAVEATLQDLIDEALERNPRILAAQARYEAAKARIPQASSLEDPRFDYKYDRMIPRMVNSDSENPGAMRVYGVTQEFPFPTKLLLRGQIASKEAQIVYAQYLEKKNAVISEVKTLYAELALIYKTIEIIRENKLLLEQLNKSASSRYSVGKSSQQDVLKAQVEIAKMDNELVLLEQRRQVLQARLNTVLNRDPSLERGSVAVRERPAKFPELAKLNELGREHRQELAGYRLAVDRAKKMVALAKQEYLPDFMIRYERMERDSRLKEWAGMVGVTLPLWFWQKQNFNVKEMKAELKGMQAVYQEEENAVFLEIKENYAELEAAGKLLALYRTAYLPQAEQTLKASLSGYESNQVDFLNVLDSTRLLLEFKLDYYRILIRQEIAFAELEKATGRELGGERTGGHEK